MSVGPGTEWLRARARAELRHDKLVRDVELRANPEIQELMHKQATEPWPKLSRILPEERHIFPGDGHNNMAAVTWYGGRVRRSRGQFGQSSGLVPWYVPEGAEWDIVDPNSTKTLAIKGECPWSSDLLDLIEEHEILEHYHWQADWLKQCESDDYDLPCRRPPVTRGLECDLFDEIALEERYRRMCEYKGWHYEPLMSRTPDVDDDWRHAS